MAKVNRYKDNNGSTTSVWNDSGSKRYGFVSKDRAYDNPQKTRYGAGIDNMGSPYRGTVDREINTPLGKIDYGYEGDTVYGGVTPAFYSGSYRSPEEQSAWAGYNDYDVRAGRYANNGNPMYYASLNLPDNVNIPDVYKGITTPVGSFEFGTNDGNPGAYVDYQPSYYIQALANLLSRGR